MALILNDKYCFVHLFKTGGNWVRDVLAEVAKDRSWTRHNSGDHHGFPQCDVSGMTVFTFVRDPSYWYRSFWAHRQAEGWRFFHHGGLALDNNLWLALLTATQPYASDNFDNFVSNCTTGLPELVYWVFNSYAAWPRTDHVFQIETARSSLMRLFGYKDLSFLDGVPEIVNATSTRLNIPMPDINPETEARIRIAERRTYLRYGYE